MPGLQELVEVLDRVQLAVIEPIKGCFKKGDRHLEDSEPVPFLKRFLIGRQSHWV
jgi:hypothetical protein